MAAVGLTLSSTVTVKVVEPVLPLLLSVSGQSHGIGANVGAIKIWFDSSCQ